jgi:zinc/manganese transport system substrate-binding protein
MKAVAFELTGDLARLQPKHAAYFAANAATFAASLIPWELTLKRFAREHADTPVAVTEPVGNYMLRSAGARIMTPFGLEADVMNGVDPAPQDVTAQRNLISRHLVKALLYNQQVTDSLTDSFLAQARRARIPVVGLYETMPAGYDYQSWMTAELRALERAVAQGISTEKLT